MAHRRTIIPPGMEQQYAEWQIAPGLLIDDTLYSSGQIGIDASGSVSSDPETQFTQAFEHVGAILEAADLGFEDVVEILSFHIGLLEHMPAFGKVRARYVHEPYPAETAVGVAELGIPGALVEIRVTALRGGRGS